MSNLLDKLKLGTSDEELKAKELLAKIPEKVTVNIIELLNYIDKSGFERYLDYWRGSEISYFYRKIGTNKSNRLTKYIPSFHSLDKVNNICLIFGDSEPTENFSYTTNTSLLNGKVLIEGIWINNI